MNNSKIYLCKADRSLLGSITGIISNTCNLIKNATDLWELTFDVNRYIDVDGTLIQSDYYDSIDEMMRLYLDSNDIQAFFVIDSEPRVSGDGSQEVKSVTAHSIECELCNMYLKNFKVNCGTSDSQEYLACDIDKNGNKNYYNINPYTGLPYNYISLVNYDDPQLSLLHLVLEGSGWTVKEGLDADVYIDKKNYFKTVIHTVKSPSGNSPECVTGYVKKRCNKNKNVYAIELQKWGSSGIEFTTDNTSDITITAQSTNTVSINNKNGVNTVSLPSPITLVDSDNKFYDNTEGLKIIEWKSEDDNGITLTYKNLKPGTYKIISPYYCITDNSGNKIAYDYGVQIKSITVSEHSPASPKPTVHIFNSSDLSAQTDNEEIIGICQIKKSFETSDSIYSFLMKTISPAASVIFEFDRKNKQVGIVKVENYGDDTGVFVSMRNLINSFEVNSTSNDSIITKLTPTGANNLGVEYVNFGKDYIINLDYFMNTLNEYGNYKYVSTKLHDKYGKWKHYRDEEHISVSVNIAGNTKIILEGTRREVYAQLSRLYNKTITDISELRNRLPNDGCMIDYRTYKLDELKTAYTAYNNALDALITIYKKEYGVTDIDYTSQDYTPTPSTATNIKDTPYWHDFYAYTKKIIPSVEEAFKMYCKTDSNGNLETDKDGNFIELEFGNPDYYEDYSILKEVDSYLYECSLYGLDELEAKKKAWYEAANLLFDECFIFSETPAANETDSPSITYRTPEKLSDSEWDNLSDGQKSRFTGWNSLSEEQKSRFTTFNAYADTLNQYLDYMSYDKRENSLTNTKCRGVIRQCEDAITKRMSEISAIEQIQSEYYKARKELADSVILNEDFKLNDNADTLFTPKDINIINSMIREQTFSNENILITSLDDIISTIDAQEELYQSAVARLYEISQPQYSFKTELDNLYSLEEFKAYQKPFDIGNFIRVGLEIHEEIHDNNFIKLRLISISYNPLEISENLSIEFSTMTKSMNGISDIIFLLNNETSSSGTSSSSSSSGGGAYGNNNANVQISNNMLNALLNTELFGTAVNDVILDTIKANKGNFNTLFSHSGVFDSLEAGRIKVSGECLFDTIKSSNYIKGKSGSILDLFNGSFDFAGGRLTWDGSKFNIIADSFLLSSGKSINDIAEEKAAKKVNDFIDSIYNPKIANLQAQIDDQIVTWYYDYEPTLNNVPASEWNTDIIKAKHEGDLFYWKSKGFAYRFYKDGASWKWQLVQDTDITKALAQAAIAQDTADSKRRIFVAQPTPPYDVGDLWTQGINGDIMTCVTARTTGSYIASDWQKCNKYIDKTAANTAAQSAVKAQTQKDIFNKLTNNGTLKGVYMEDGELYINATYLKSGFLSANLINGGTLTLGGENNANGKLKILNSSGNQIGTWDKEGITATNCNITGGTIAGWNFNEKAFYKNFDNIGNKNGIYFGNDGLSLGNFFTIYTNGFILRDTEYKYAKISNKSISCGNTTSNIDRIYCIYEAEKFSDNHIFYLYIVRDYYCTIPLSDSEHNEHGYLRNVVSRYKFNKSNINNNLILSDENNINMIKGLSNYIATNNIGYINFDDLTKIDDNFDEVLDESFPTWAGCNIDKTYLQYIYTTSPSFEDDYESVDIIGVYYNNNTYDKIPIPEESNNGMMINSYDKTIKINDTFMSSKGFSSKYLYDNVAVSGKPLYINSDGTIGLSSSSKRFKNSISTNLTEIANPHALYDIDIVQYKYNDNYFSSPHDEGIGKYFIGFIAEDIAEKFKNGATFDRYGLPDGWDIRYMFPAALKLIQELNERVTLLENNA